MNRTSFLVLCSLTPAAGLASAAPAGATSMPESLLSWAERLVAELAPANNVYGSHPTYVEWSDAASGRVARNRSVCSSFANHLLERSFGYTPADLAAWFGKPVPHAIDYHATIVARNGVKRIVHAGAIRPGDIIGIAFPPGTNPTGHVMVAASSATPREATAPAEPNTRQYELEVIDSASTGHGPGDTRHHPDGTRTTGVGRGVLRLYARPDDTIAGYAWSTSTHSLFRSAAIRRPAIGRLDPARAPHPSGTSGAPASGSDAESTGDDGPSADAQ